MPIEPGFWEDLLDAIEEGQVVPIIGRDLLVIETEAGPRKYHEIVGERLARELDLGDRLPPGSTALDHVITTIASDVRPNEIRRHVTNIAKAVNAAVEPPRALRQLAEIAPLRLFVSTTFDNLLERALQTARGTPPALRDFPSSISDGDFNEDEMQRQGSFVFHLLGRARRSSFFAVTEADVLEQMHNLMSERAKWEKLGARLANSHLLMLGVSFPDWLARFLLKLGRKTHPLWHGRDQIEVIVDTEHLQREFATFIRLYSPESRLFSGGSPTEFVGELHDRWTARHPRPAATRARAMTEVEGPADMRPGAIFISYATEDREAAYRLADALESSDLDVWIDRRLAPGDDFHRKIESHIKQCCAFVAVISRVTETETRDRYFFRERQLACDRWRDRPPDESFVFPVVIDETPPGGLKKIPTRMMDCKVAIAQHGDPPDDLVKTLHLLQRNYRAANSDARGRDAHAV